MPVVVKFMRQLAHDLRNHLNAAELQAAYLAEIVDDSEARDEIKRLRSMISQVGASLQRVTTAMSAPKLTEMSYVAADLIGDLQQKLATEFPNESKRVQWEINVGAASLEIDPQILLPALLELFANAFRNQSGEENITAEARVENGRFFLAIHEPKQAFEQSTEDWGRQPLGTIRQGHYGLGLHRSRGIIEAHRGSFKALFDKAASQLITTIELPVEVAT